MQSPKISLCMIVKNEERFLPDCLESVKEIVDEIIIVDTGSTDKTIEIAKSYGAKVFSFEWRNDFAMARNKSLEHATGDWILIMDADERLAPGQVEKIKKYTNMNFDGLYVRIVNFDRNGKIGEVSEYPRLFKRKKEFKFEGKIHEQIGLSIIRSGGKIAKTDIVINHLGYAHDDETMRKKYYRNLELLLAQVKENPNDAYSFYHIGVIKILLGEIEEGIDALRRSISIQESNLSPGVRSVVLNILSKYELSKGNYDEALKLAERSISFARFQVSAYFIKGEVYLSKGEFARAIPHYKKALGNLDEFLNGEPIDISVESKLEREEIIFKLGLCYLKVGDVSKSRANFLLLAKNNFYLEKIVDFLIDEYKSGNLYVISLLEDFAKVSPSFKIHKILAGIYQIEGDLGKAIHHLERALNFSDDDEIRYNLGVCLVGLGRLTDAKECLNILAQKVESKFYEASLNVLSAVNLSLGDYDGALACYKILLSKNPADTGLISKVANVFRRALENGVELKV